MRLGNQLRQLAVGDDAAQLDSELQSITDRYTALRSRSEHRLSQMTEVPAILERFYTSHETVMNWVSQLESDLQQRDVQPGPEAELHLQVSSSVTFSDVTSKLPPPRKKVIPPMWTLIYSIQFMSALKLLCEIFSEKIMP